VVLQAFREPKVEQATGSPKRKEQRLLKKQAPGEGRAWPAAGSCPGSGADPGRFVWHQTEPFPGVYYSGTGLAGKHCLFAFWAALL
jgi:hypothetical protein